MIDIVIKSYNRAYLLDRVLYSVFLFAKQKGNVIILDDGTPSVYLDRLQQKYPSIIIKQPSSKKNKDQKAPPIQFWRSEINNCSDYVIVLEDDIWFTHEIDLEKLEVFLNQEKVDFFKLKWWSNPEMIRGDFKVSVDQHFGIVKPNLKIFSEALVKNKFYLHSIANLVKIMPSNYFLSLYTVYDVAGQVFSKNFYKYIWPENQIKIEEMIQLGLAAQYFRINKDRHVGRVDQEFTTTSFCSSSVGTVEKYGFDMSKYNGIWNQNWLNGKLDPLKGFPSDFSLTYLEEFVQGESGTNKWKNWSIGWRRHFQNLGSDLSMYNNIKELV